MNPILTHCIIGWGGIGSTIIYPLLKAQKAIIWVITRIHFRYPSALLYKDSNLLDVCQCLIIKTITNIHENKKFISKIEHAHLTTNRGRHYLTISVSTITSAKYTHQSKHKNLQHLSWHIISPEVRNANCHPSAKRFPNGSLNWEERSPRISENTLLNFLFLIFVFFLFYHKSKDSDPTE